MQLYRMKNRNKKEKVIKMELENNKNNHINLQMQWPTLCADNSSQKTILKSNFVCISLGQNLMAFLFWIRPVHFDNDAHLNQLYICILFKGIIQPLQDEQSHHRLTIISMIQGSSENIRSTPKQLLGDSQSIQI